MRYQNKPLILLNLTLVLVMLTLVVSACDPGYFFLVKNRTGQTLTIYISVYTTPQERLFGTYIEGDVKPGAEIQSKDFIGPGSFSVEAKNTQGKLVYYKEFSNKEVWSTGGEVEVEILSGYPLLVQNRTEQSITIFLGVYTHKDKIYDKYNIGDIKPRTEIEHRTPQFEKYSIEAKNAQGEVVYSENFTWHELHDIDWKVVIPPLEKEPESSDNVTGDK